MAKTISLQEKIQAAAREFNMDTRHAAALVWASEGGEETTVHTPAEWADAMVALQEREVWTGPAHEDPSVAKDQGRKGRDLRRTLSEPGSEATGASAELDAAVSQRAAELKAQADSAAYRQQALAEIIDAGGSGVWTPVDTSQPQVNFADVQERPDADTVLVRQVAKERGISEQEAMADLYDKGEIG